MKFIFLVDDNAIERDIIKRNITKCPEYRSAEFLESSCLSDAKKLILENGPEAIRILITDHNLPDGESLDLIEFLADRGFSLPVLVITGSVNPKVGADVIKMGAHEYVNKSELSPAVLSKAISSAEHLHQIKINEELYHEDLKSFAARLAHDLRDPISSIFAVLHLLDVEDENSELLLAAKHRLNFTIEFIDNLLKFSISQKKETVNFSIEDLLKEVIGLFNEEGLVDCVSIDALPEFVGDPGLIKILVRNLVTNSIKYRRKDVPLKINIHMDGDELVIEDNGIGFSPKEAQEIFKPLIRLHKNEEAGYGLGLATCLRIVNLHGGSIRAHGDSGKGCKVFIKLPRKSQLLAN